RRVDPHPELADAHAVDLDPALGDELLARAARAEARGREHLLQAHTVLDVHVALRLGRLPAPRTARGAAGTARARTTAARRAAAPGGLAAATTAGPRRPTARGTARCAGATAACAPTTGPAATRVARPVPRGAPAPPVTRLASVSRAHACPSSVGSCVASDATSCSSGAGA